MLVCKRLMTTNLRIIDLELRLVMGSIPDGVIGISQQHNPSGHTMVLGMTQPLTEMSTKCISWGIRAAGA